MNTIVCTAIRSLRVIEFGYEDQQGNAHHRVVEPYGHGVTTQGNEAVRGYQIDGTSESPLPGWRLFRLDRMFNLETSESTNSATAPGYAHGDSDLDPIFCMVP